MNFEHIALHTVHMLLTNNYLVIVRQGRHRNFIPAGLITSFNEAGGTNMIQPDAGKIIESLPSRNIALS